ncbi:hypothetical protein FXO38_23118 [Capsicum annuum]|nr:hypothetical protein FXO38_23118 [Capsicum annuum]
MKRENPAPNSAVDHLSEAESLSNDFIGYNSSTDLMSSKTPQPEQKKLTDYNNNNKPSVFPHSGVWERQGVRSLYHYLRRSRKMMADEGLVPSPEEKIKRKNAINKLKKIVRVWVNTVAYDHALPKRYLRFASGTILTYGSYGLGVHDSELDIDPLCVGPYFAILELASRVADELGYGKHRVRYAEIKFSFASFVTYLVNILIRIHAALVGVSNIIMKSILIDVVKVLKDGDLQTIGMLDYNKRLQHFFTSHLKVDSVTANAWEEEDDVVLITCRLQNPDLDAINGTEKEQQRDDFTNEL